ncbi:MAG TPA: FGGY-family carbohydrate kinase [Acidimicrobiales bacterium]|nr:FGGY-family carbohydrate kinase [Acidimicrobiales bacterium]
MSVVVGVDVGSSSARALAVRPDGSVAAASGAGYRGVSSWPAGRADPGAWRIAVEEALGLLGRELAEASRPVALAIGGQSPTTVPLDGGFAVTCSNAAGAELDPVSQHAAQREALGVHGVEVAQLWDWLLTSLGAPLRQGRWFGEPPLAGFGPRASTGEVIGEADGTWGVAGGTPLVPGAQDAYLAFWAAGLVQPRRGCDPGGRTGGLGVVVTDQDRPAGMFGLRSAARGASIVGGPVNAHGLALEWLGRITGRSVSELVDLAAGSAAGAGGVVFLPYLEGERAPRWNRSLRAELAGLSSSTEVSDLARAALEGAAYGLAHIAGRLVEEGVEMDVLVCGGSPSKSRLWCEVKASVLGIPVDQSAVPELAAYGAALAAGAGAGWWALPGGDPASWPTPPMCRIDPVPDPTYADALARFIELGDAAELRLTTTRR